MSVRLFDVSVRRIGPSRWGRRLVLIVVAVASVLVVTSPGALAASKTTYYVSVGDSLAQGFQPTGGPYRPLGSSGYQHGYADQLFKAVRDRYEQFQLVKLGCGGESTKSMVLGTSSSCAFPAGSQLAQAEEFLRAHRDEVAFVTIDIGANDLSDSDIVTYLPQILDGLRAAAGPGVPIIGMSYYAGGLPDVWNQTHDLTAVQNYVEQVVEPFNGLLESIYAAHGDPVADVQGAFQADDLTLVGGTPLNVVRECQWTWQCTPPPHGPDIHANTTGYGVIAQAFEQQLP